MLSAFLSGKIGEILAPMIPSNQLHLSIQHGKNLEIINFLNEHNESEWKGISEVGYSAMYIACKYSNFFAINLLLERGISMHDATDRNGNRPLHVASKYGHLDVCKLFIDKGANLLTKNHQNQTAYDVGTDHIVRQYLLPLQLKCEGEEEDKSNIGNNSSSSNNHMMPAGYQQPAFHQQQQQIYSQPEIHSVQRVQMVTSSSVDLFPGQSSSSAVKETTPASNANISSNSQPVVAAAAPAVVVPKIASIPIIPVHAHPSSSSSPSLPMQQKLPQPPVLIHQQQQPPPLFNHVSHTTNVTTATAPPQGINTTSSIARSDLLAPTAASLATTTRFIPNDGFHTSASDPLLQQKYGHKKELINIAPPPTFSNISAGNMSGSSIHNTNGYSGLNIPQYPPPQRMPTAGGAIFNRYPSTADGFSQAAIPPVSYMPPPQQQQQQPYHIMQQQQPVPVFHMNPHNNNSNNSNNTGNVNVYDPMTDHIISADATSSAIM